MQASANNTQEDVFTVRCLPACLENVCQWENQALRVEVRSAVKRCNRGRKKSPVGDLKYYCNASLGALLYMVWHLSGGLHDGCTVVAVTVSVPL